MQYFGQNDQHIDNEQFGFTFMNHKIRHDKVVLTYTAVADIGSGLFSVVDEESSRKDVRVRVRSRE